jgi:hypothetical protein
MGSGASKNRSKSPPVPQVLTIFEQPEAGDPYDRALSASAYASEGGEPSLEPPDAPLELVSGAYGACRPRPLVLVASRVRARALTRIVRACPAAAQSRTRTSSLTASLSRSRARSAPS